MVSTQDVNVYIKAGWLKTCIHTHVCAYLHKIRYVFFGMCFSFITDATVCLFGSSGSGFALTSSNVNLSVSTAGTSGNQVRV